MAGGYVFAWADEWFKLTWNTRDFEVADRRALWMNPWTNEGQFGLISSEPALAGRLVIDGDGEGWEPVSRALVESEGAIRELRATHDEGYLYLRIVTDEPESWHRGPVVVGFDVIDGDSGGLPFSPGVMEGADYAVVVDPDGARAMVRASADPLLRQYLPLGLVEAEPGEVVEGNSRWNVFRLMMNRPYTVPTTGYESPVEVFEVGHLREGTTDPGDPDFDNRTMWAASEHVIEMRVPWMAVGFSDPSLRTVYEIDDDGAFTHREVDGVEITAFHLGETFETDGYRWDVWQTVDYRERIKAGIAPFVEAVIDLNSP